MEKLINTNEFYRTLDLFIHPIIIADVKTNHFFFNKAFKSQMIYGHEAIFSIDSWFKKAYPSNEYRDKIKEERKLKTIEAQENGLPYIHMVAKVLCADNSYKWFDICEFFNNNITLITFQNVSEYQEKNFSLQKIIQQNNLLISIITHDVRTPLGNLQSIISNFELLKMNKEELNMIFSKLQVQINNTFNIIDSALLYTSSQANRFLFKCQSINLFVFINNLSKHFEINLLLKNISFTVNIAADFCIHYDAFILEIVVRNIISNAIKHVATGGFIKISTRKRSAYFELLITNSGDGLTQKEIDRILSNKNTHQQKKEVSDGFGIGLMLVKELIDKYYGQLRIESKFQKSTSFIIRLPWNIPD